MTRALLALSLLVSPVAADTLRTLDEETYTGKLVSVNNEKVVLSTDDGNVTVSTKEVIFLKIGSTVDIKGEYSDVELVDGTLLHCRSYEIKKSAVKLTTTDDQVLELKLSALNSILNNAHELANRKDWEARVLPKRGGKDLLALKQNGIVNTLAGVFGEADEKGETIEFLFGGRTVNVAFTRPFGVVFARAADPKAKPVICKLKDSNQNLIYACDVVSTEKGFSVETPAGLKRTYTKDQISMLDYSDGKVVFLSDMSFKAKALNPALTPGFGFDRPKLDTNIDGSKRIQLDGQTFDRGLAVRSPWELKFELGRDFRELKMVAGLDDNTQSGEAPVKLRILADDRELLSWTVKPTDKKRVRSIRLNIKDVQTLRVVVTRGETDDPFHKAFDLGKHLDLADARVTK